MRCVVLVAVAWALAVSSLACGKTPQGEPRGQNRESPTLLLDNGTQTHNGLNPHDFLDNLKNKNIQKAWGDRLIVPISTAQHNLNSTFDVFYPPASYKELADDMISCSVDQGVALTYGGTMPKPIDLQDAYKHYPSSILKNATVWENSKLDPNQQKAVATCLATRLNPFVTPVEIWLSGDPVVDNHAKHLPIDEALWDTEFVDRDPDSCLAPIRIYVWPNGEIKSACRDVVDASRTRVCSTKPDACELIQRDRKTDSCGLDPVTPVNGHYSCRNHNSLIQTRLSCKDWCRLYPGCTIPNLPEGETCEPGGGKPGDLCPSSGSGSQQQN